VAAPGGLGRRPAPDPRDERHLIRPLLAVPLEEAPNSRFWYDNAWWGDQGNTPKCVEFGWQHFLADGPITHKGPRPVIQPIGTLYHEAQLVDEWPGEGYDGTSVRAGAKALQARGLIGEYLWAWDAETVLTTILTKSPVVVGVNWYSSFDTPDKDGVIRISGSIRGGHAFELNGGNRARGMVRAKQSWRRDRYGKNGRFWLPMEVLDRLIHEDGEAALATEVKT
jgi:hypothetical protein